MEKRLPDFLKDKLIKQYGEKIFNSIKITKNQKVTLGQKISDKNNTIQSIVEEILTNSLCSEVIGEEKTAWQGCNDFGNDNSNNTIERVIESTDISWSSDFNTYSIKYEGYLLFPARVSGEVTFTPNCSNGFSCNNSTFIEKETLSDGRKKYQFTVIVDGNVSATLPVTDEDRKNISIIVSAQGLNPLSDAYILKPTNGTNRQRLVLLNTASPTVYLYFSGAPNCNIDAPALNYRNCTASNCTSFKPL